jgi:hypothetical protein
VSDDKSQPWPTSVMYEPMCDATDAIHTARKSGRESGRQIDCAGLVVVAGGVDIRVDRSGACLRRVHFQSSRRGCEFAGVRALRHIVEPEKRCGAFRSNRCAITSSASRR